jgi:transglutaminase-like putative cysteine protease
MRFEILHRTHYAYAAPVRESFNELRLQPASNPRQTVESFLLKVMPSTRLRHYHDFYSNCVHHFEIPEPHNSLLIESRLEVLTQPLAGLQLADRPAPLTKLKTAPETDRCYDFLQSSRYVDVGPEIWRLAVDATHGEQDLWQIAVRLMDFVHKRLTYAAKSTTVHTHMRDVLARGMGVCQDFAHVLLGLCRSLQIPARYVSGYLATETASATHAWTEVFVPGHGWAALDPTHNRVPDESYVQLATGRDYADVAPVSGTYKGTTERTLTVSVEIQRKD